MAEFTEQDREDVMNVLDALKDQAFGEFMDSADLPGMFKPLQEFVVRAAMIGDETFGSENQPELQAACKRILGSGRFDFYA